MSEREPNSPELRDDPGQTKSVTGPGAESGAAKGGEELHFPPRELQDDLPPSAKEAQSAQEASDIVRPDENATDEHDQAARRPDESSHIQPEEEHAVDLPNENVNGGQTFETEPPETSMPDEPAPETELPEATFHEAASQSISNAPGEDARPSAGEGQATPVDGAAAPETAASAEEPQEKVSQEAPAVAESGIAGEAVAETPAAAEVTSEEEDEGVTPQETTGESAHSAEDDALAARIHIEDEASGGTEGSEESLKPEAAGGGPNELVEEHSDAGQISPGPDEGGASEEHEQPRLSAEEIHAIPGMVVPPAVAGLGPVLAGLTEGSGSGEPTSAADAAGPGGTANETPESERAESEAEMNKETAEVDATAREASRPADESPEVSREEVADGAISGSTDGLAGAGTIEEASADEPEAVEETSVESMAESASPGALEGIVSDEETGGDEEPVVREEVVDDLAHIIESIVFASDEPLSVATIKSVLDAAHTFGRVNPDMITLRIGALNAKYDADGTGFHIVDIANGYQYATRKEHAQWVSNLFKERSKRRLSNSALETVAIIAYKQPITKPEIESIRGVNVDYVLHNLLEKELVTVVGRAETVGRPLLYGTTQKFLKVFALKSLDDLPKLREIDEIIKEIKSKGAEESIQLEITALGDSSSPETAAEGETAPETPSENGAE